MNLALPRWALLGAAVVLGGLAIGAGPNEATAVPAAGVALVCAAGFAALSLLHRVRFRFAPLELPESHSLVALRQSFREGPIGRQRIAQAILELERETLGRPEGRASDAVALKPEAVDPKTFRAWVRERLDELEGST